MHFGGKFKEVDHPKTEKPDDSHTRIVEELVKGITEKNDMWL